MNLFPESCMKIDENFFMSHTDSSSNILILKHFAYIVKGVFTIFLINFHPMGEPETFICGVTKGSQ